ncbi:DEAD/DEAH box helicase family protein, partial [Streptomyces sp. NPDC007369]|uniref:DEAD/DEAH box helicase family protein n=1 Tax=Streptomyces sp. NPDC007369 TaxID=3154589 RepID=UPI0033E317C4
MSAPRELRPHQVEAVAAAVSALDTPPKGIPVNGLRASVVAACGTGKTLIAAHSALRIAKGGRILVMLPTLDLLSQTVREWRTEGHDGKSIAVCSLDDDAGLYAAGVRTTTNPVILAERYGAGPVTMYATYASLPVLTKAFCGEYGEMQPFDLIVVDEAHRTSGSLGKAWAAIHRQSAIPAARRLYFTATPRIWRERPPSWEVREGARDPLPAELACSMDDPAVYGPIVYELGLADAISLGL